MRVSLSAQHLVKRYGGVVALADGSLDVGAGEVVALLGANGSGKSTLSKILTGVVSPDGGHLLLDGQPVRFASPHAAQIQGIAAVYQELSLVPDMTVAENIWLGHEPLTRGRFVRTREIRTRTAELLDLFAGTIQPSLRPDTVVATLPQDEQQIVEILKAASRRPRIIILDEATASLDSRQVSRLFELVSTWKTQGMAVVFVSHRMEEIFRIADRAIVLRNGKTVAAVQLDQTDQGELIELMIGGGMAVRRVECASLEGALVRLRAERLQTAVLRGVDLHVRDGELLGLGGLQGQGQADVLLALFGAIPFRGRVTLGDREVRFSHPRQAMRAGVAFVPGDRSNEGLLPVRSILENLLLPNWPRYGSIVRIGSARQDASEIARRLRLVMSSLEAPVSSLSGGNAQKVVLGKWLLRNPKLLLLNDPTKGIDVGAKRELYAIFDELRKAGTAIILYSSDDEELLHLCDRVLVLHDGQIQAELADRTLTRSALVAASMGTAHRTAA